MEALKRKRTQFRREFSKIANQYEKAVQDEIPAEGIFLNLADRAEELFSCESAIRDLWCEQEAFDEAAYQEDQDQACKYKARWADMKAIVQKEKSENTTIVSNKHPDARPKLPKLEIVKFDGDIKKWLLFWGQFKKIHEDLEIADTDKLQYLLQSMEKDSSARKLVESYPPCGENYNKVLEALTSRFAREDLLIETYVRGLLALMQQKNNGGLTTLYDSLQTHLQALETLGVTKDKYASILFPMVESALPEEILRAWNRTRGDMKSSDLAKLVEFLKQEVESEERIQLALHSPATSSLTEPKLPTCCFVTETPANKLSNASKCIWCEKDTHSSVECHKASKMTLEQKIEHVKAKKGCTICLRRNHNAKRCKSFPKCLLCQKRHSVIMCPNIPSEETPKKEKPEPEKATSLLCGNTSTTLLQTLVVQVASPDGKKIVRARALIDNGAQRSYIREDLARELSLKPRRKEFVTHSVFGGKEEECSEHNVYDIRLTSLTNDFDCRINVTGRQNICGILPKIRSCKVIERLQINQIELTDINDNAPDDVTILIGADYAGLIMTGDFIDLGLGLNAIRTKLGWTLQGPIAGAHNSISSTLLITSSSLQLQDLWNLESLGIKDPAEQSSKVEHEARILRNFEDTITINEEGRYEVSLPWLDVPRPQRNYPLAEKRLISTTKRLQQLGKIEQYSGVFNEWLDLDIIEVAPDQNVKGHYIAHHPVIKESSLTTKIRPVYDASAKDNNGISLNSCLEKGVNLLEQIPNLLINFRKEAIGVTADIAKAFLQISLLPADRDYLRFLWWLDINDLSKGTVTYRHKRVVFGVVSSPFHLIATINHHLDRSPKELRKTAIKLKQSFYVDNCVTSVKSREALEKFISESKKLMSDGKFDLRGWVSSPIHVCDQTKSMSVLGVVWDVQEDSLRCNVDTLKVMDEKLTKRSLLSVMQRVFDPIGITCPTTIIPRMIIQKTWPMKLSWDEELPDDLADEFKTWLNQVHFISECTIPRPFASFPLDQSENSLHVFCDASKDAYAVCVFLRSEFKGKIEVKLVLGKSRVTPISKVKKITIPRLELIAATLSTRLAKTAKDSIALANCRVYYWTDSSVVLTWIKGDGDWSVFVTNRINEIKAFSAPSDWRHVPGNLNPADLPSRGITPKRLLESRWWEGPEWLRFEEQSWPTAAFETDLERAEEERRKTVSTMLIESDSFLDKLRRYFSVYSKIVRMIAWILRLKYKSVPFVKEITCEEYDRAEITLIKLIQGTYENNILKNNSLETFADDTGIVRLKTKLALGSESADFKFPIILPGSEPIVQRMVLQRHILLQHAGVQTLMCNLRERFWIVGLRRLCRKAVDSCMKCKRFKAKSCQPPAGNLPIERMETTSAFEVSGVDLAGPLILKTGSKAWIVLFTCATYRAIHLETVESLSTAEFIMALRRFIARRGRVACLYSDNGTNFRGLNNAFAALDWSEILRFSSVARIKWKFLPPSAPWWGGFYERLIGVVKQTLRRVLGRASLSLLELNTVLCDCEATINNRPLTYFSNSQDELRPLTPSMFIQPLLGNDVADLDKIDSRTLNARARYCQTLREGFRGRFRNEYLSRLVLSQGRRNKHNVKVGDKVLVETEDHRRTNWPIGIVIETFPSVDGVVRVARVRTAAGEKMRPVQRLYPLKFDFTTT